MSMSVRFSSWREAYDFALSEVRSGQYAGWGRAAVLKNDGRECVGGHSELCFHDGTWWADIA